MKISMKTHSAVVKIQTNVSSVDTDPGQETNDETHGTRVGSMCQLGKRMGNLVGSQDGWSSTPALPFKWGPMRCATAATCAAFKCFLMLLNGDQCAVPLTPVVLLNLHQCTTEDGRVVRTNLRSGCCKAACRGSLVVMNATL